MPQPTNKEEGAGDQGIMFGYACNETPELMPAPIYYAHNILQSLADGAQGRARRSRKLGPDAKSQVTVRYENGKPVGVTQIVVSHQHHGRKPDLEAGAQDRRALCAQGAARGLDQQGHGLAHQSDRQILHRRPGWRYAA